MASNENMDISNVRMSQFNPVHSSTQLGDLNETNIVQTSSTLKKYKKLIQKILKKEYESSSPDFTNLEKEALSDIMNEAEALYKQSETGHELLSDAKVFKQLAKICRQYAEEISLNKHRFLPSEYAEKLRSSMGRGYSDGDGEVTAMQWARLGTKLQPIFNRTAHIQSMYSAFPRDEGRQRKEKAPKLKASNRKSEATKANVVDFSKEPEDQSSSNTTDKFVGKAYKCLKDAYNENDREAICYFSFVLDPQSFGRSVENIFYVSFLVKEGKARVFYDDETGVPMIQPRKNRQTNGGASQLAGKKQVMVSFTMDDWIKHKNALQIERAMIVR